MVNDISANRYWYAYTIIAKYAFAYYRVYANDLSYYVQCLTFSDTQEFFIIYTARLQVHNKVDEIEFELNIEFPKLQKKEKIKINYFRFLSYIERLVHQ